MLKHTKIYLFLLVLNILISNSVSAKTVEQKNINFPVKADELIKGEIHYFFTILSPRKLAVQHPDLFELDSLSLLQESNVGMVVGKTVYIANKPVGFFEEKQLTDERYVKHVLGDQKVKKTGPDAFVVIVPGKEGYTYKMQSFFDADDVSTLPNSKVIRAVNSAKKLDVISKGASTIMFTEKTNYSRVTEGGVVVTSFIPLNEKKTLVISYNLYAIPKSHIKSSDLKTGFLEEAQAIKNLQDSFK